ncbi:hypothetical protein F4778DRAFT_134838 [Xylariomycetidae sp. FL2044]|nr:hypothetical protein F4778DRAFT_134838 [Xylariomycetidae sp. FL2044]
MYRAATRRVPTTRQGLKRASPLFSSRITLLSACSSSGSSFTTSPPRLNGLGKPSRIGQTTLPKHDDTIYALSSAHGKAGIAVIRISGPACQYVHQALCPDKPLPKPRYATVRTLYHPESSAFEILDSAALALFFPGPKTVTGDDVLELHVHGGSATVKAVLSAIPKCSKGGAQIRYAEPGEFTKRAFLNDRLDLAQVEALSETLSAETEQQRRAAVRGSSGALGRTYEEWRRRLLQARAEMEALIDFSEDQHFDESPSLLVGNVSRQVEQILRSIATHEHASQRGELLRSGIKIALIGPPNVGKSSFMNQIVGREASIVSGESGTTRDIIEANLDIRGFLCTFADTAGFRSSTGRAVQSEAKIGAVEEEGIRRARAKAEQSDVIIALVSVEPRDSGGHEIRYDVETLRLAAKCRQSLVVLNKREAIPAPKLHDLVQEFKSSVLVRVEGLETVEPLLISCKEAQDQSSDLDRMTNDPGGIRQVADLLAVAFQDMTSLPAALQDLHGVTERQRQLLVQCRGHLVDYLESAGTGVDTDPRHDHGDVGAAGSDDVDITMAAEHLRYAATCLGRITGHGEAGDVEEVLGVIFEKFCVGK